MNDIREAGTGMGDRSEHRELYERIGSVETRTAAHEAELRAIRETMQSISATVQRMDQRLMEGWQSLRQEVERSVNQVRPQKGQWIGVASLAIAAVGVVGLFIAMNREQMAVVEERQYHIAIESAATRARLDERRRWDRAELENLRDDVERIRAAEDEERRYFTDRMDERVDRISGQIEALRRDVVREGSDGQGQ